ncbi:hypothetical protein CWATWH0005_5274 [Crocosphaera watsonii WH 0005]|uniref:Uncharacterized protein n=1 Tax=Crocosphaera watsonii WH 0005 TaxID=423472 RepID=T2J1X1_CROWT|nr:hypothetical protein CWATWH0005_5274 [Crocosphaera watsonii WH 0005]
MINKKKIKIEALPQITQLFIVNYPLSIKNRASPAVNTSKL